MRGDGNSDYETYVNTLSLLACQKSYESLCNRDELMFQMVHQQQELWMKLIAHTLLDICDFLEERQSLRVLSLFRRVHLIQAQQIEALSILDTMSPRDYQTIRAGLGQGSGQESPGFRVLRQLADPLWACFNTHYLLREGRTVDAVYQSAYSHDEAFMVAEALAEFDQRFQRFRQRHLQLVMRTLGEGAFSLKGRPVEVLGKGTGELLFPMLWSQRGGKALPDTGDAMDVHPPAS